MSDMNMHELTDEIAGRLGVSGRQAGRFLAALADVITSNASDGVGTRISGVGHIRIREAKERRSLDVTTGGPITIPAHRAVAFTAAGRLRDAAKEGEDGGNE